MAKNHDSSPFLFPSNFPSYPSESTTPSSPPFHSSKSISSLQSPYKSCSSPPRNLHSGSSSSRLTSAAFGPCAACKFHNRQCSENCYLASFLPPNEVHKKLAVVESVFGSGNVDNFLQRISNSSYIPLLLLLKDTSQEDRELDLDHKNMALSETEINNELGVCVSLKNEFRDKELIQESKVHLSSLFSSDTNRDHLVQKILSAFEKSLSILHQSELKSSDALIDTHTASNDPESPVKRCDSPGTCSANYDGLSLEYSKKRIIQPTLTQAAQMRASDRMKTSRSSYLQRTKSRLGRKKPTE